MQAQTRLDRQQVEPFLTSLTILARLARDAAAAGVYRKYVETSRKRAMLSWLFLGALTLLSLSLGVLQYRWVGEVSRAERERLRGSLENSLHRLALEFNTEMTAACAALVGGGPEPDPKLREQQYVTRYANWKESARHEGMVRGVWLAAAQGGALRLRALNVEQGSFEPAEWPRSWLAIRERIEMTLAEGLGPGRRMFGPAAELPDVIELPRMDRFGPDDGTGRGPDRGPERGPFRELPNRPGEWLFVAMDLDYVRTAIIPELLERHLASGGSVQYQAAVVWREDPSTVIFESEPGLARRIPGSTDASVHLMDLRMDMLFRRPGIRRPGGLWERFAGRRGMEGRAGPGEPMFDRGRWTLLVRHRAGSLEAVVATTRRRNLAVTGGILLLIMGAAVALVRFTRRAQTLADLQMEFVAGISHELRTPLSVMRTAGHNLRGRMAEEPARVQRYGELIEDESKKLGAIVEQVLRFASAQAGRVVDTRERIQAGAFIDEILESEQGAIEEAGVTLDRRIAPALPEVWIDRTALGQALRNLIGNAVKYGAPGHWVGVTAEVARRHGEPAVAIRITDRGPGIPRDELARVFDPFYRGKRAVEEQIHGTGLGLSLARRIVEAHGGSITVHSEPGKGTEFLVRIPAAPSGEHGSENSTG